MQETYSLAFSDLYSVLSTSSGDTASEKNLPRSDQLSHMPLSILISAHPLEECFLGLLIKSK